MTKACKINQYAKRTHKHKTQNTKTLVELIINYRKDLSWDSNFKRHI